MRRRSAVEPPAEYRRSSSGAASVKLKYRAPATKPLQQKERAPISISDCGLRIADSFDCGLRISDCGLKRGESCRLLVNPQSAICNPQSSSGASGGPGFQSDRFEGKDRVLRLSRSRSLLG